MQRKTFDSVLILTPTLFEAKRLFGERDADFRYTEKASIATSYDGKQKRYRAICGFGLASAGAGAGFRLSQSTTRDDLDSPVILAGIAGTYQPEKYPVGSVVCASSVRCFGIGAGSGDEHQSSEAMGWEQGLPLEGLPPAYDFLALSTAPNSTELTGLFLSVASASGNMAEANARVAKFPEAVGEEMEGFAVALACRNYGRPLFMIRGISNVAGERDKEHWKTNEALTAARVKLEEAISELFSA